MTTKKVQQRQMETQWLADPVLSKQTWGQVPSGFAAAWGHPVCPSLGKG